MASHRRNRARHSAAGRSIALTAAAAAAVLAAGGGVVGGVLDGIASASPSTPKPSPGQGGQAEDATAAGTGGPGGTADAAGAVAGGSAAAGGPAAARERVEALYAQAEEAGQRYDAVLQQEQDLQRRAADVQARIAVEQQQINETAQSLGALAGAQYRQGSLPVTAALVFGGHPQDVLDGADTFDMAGRNVAQMVALERSRRAALDRDRATAESQLADVQRLRASLAAAKEDIQRRLAAARAVLGSLTAAERARVLAADGAVGSPAAQAAAAALVASGGEAAPDARAAAAVAAAESMLGRPYVYGAAGPSAFDCSGLMYWAWQRAGVTLPRTSEAQASAGRRIPLSQARPGDLVIYYGDMHHVGMYVGHGMVIHAPHTGARVRYERVTDMPVAAVVRV